MSKANNLTDFLTDVANAIRAKMGTTGKMNPQEFATAITQIPNFVAGAIVETTYGGGGLYMRAETNSTTYITVEYLGNKANLYNGDAINVPIPSNGISVIQFDVSQDFYADRDSFIVIDNVDYGEDVFPSGYTYQIVIYDMDLYILQI